MCDSNTTYRGLTWRAGVHHGFRCVYVCLDGVIYFKLSVKIATVTQHVSSNQPKATVWTLRITFTMNCLHTSSPNVYILIIYTWLVFIFQSIYTADQKFVISKICKFIMLIKAAFI